MGLGTDKNANQSRAMVRETVLLCCHGCLLLLTMFLSSNCSFWQLTERKRKMKTERPYCPTKWREWTNYNSHNLEQNILQRLETIRNNSPMCTSLVFYCSIILSKHTIICVLQNMLVQLINIATSAENTSDIDLQLKYRRL